MAITEVKAQDLRKKLNLNIFPFKTTDEIDPLDTIIGQDRAIRAIELALNIDHSGYNVFVTGLSGTGKTTIVQDLLRKMARKQPVPSDWVYVYNFDSPDAPDSLELPAGKSREFQRDMADLIRTLRREIPAAFSSEEYDQQKMAILNQLQESKRRIIQQLEEEASAGGIQLQNTPAGFQTVILKDNQPMTQEQYEALDKTEKDVINQRLEAIQEKINETGNGIVKLEKQSQQKLRLLNENVATFVATRYINELKSEYHEFPNVLQYLEKVNRDIILNIGDFLTESKKQQEKPGDRSPQTNHFKRYDVNIIVDNSGTRGAPVVFEPNPTYNNLFGRIEKQLVMGAQVTDFTMIKSGSLQKANGGYLMTDAYHVLQNPFVYDALKRAIKTRQIAIENISELQGYMSAADLRPQPIPLNLKVILTGWSQIYYGLQAYDQDFNKIFKIRADFDNQTDSKKETILRYAQFVKRVCSQENLMPFHRTAVREIVYHGNRLVDDQEKLSLRFGAIVGIIREANYFAKKENHNVVRAKHVQQAISEHEFRHSMVEDKMQEMYKRDIFMIDTAEEKVGQINGLSVYALRDHSFGRPARITAKTYIGTENVVNIERKVRLSGKIHDKGLMILSGFFNSKFGMNMPLSFSASLTFEQSYSTIDGDSASSTELYALISSLADMPIKQGIAVTGSVNQNGEIQAIGGANQKIEGFYAVCKEKGLTGQQGVIIPRSNLVNLTLKEEIVKAVRSGKFNIWAIDTIEDGLKILTGMDAGERLKNGKFPKKSLYGLVEKKLRTFAKTSADFRKSIGATRKRKTDKKNDQGNNNRDGEEEEE